MAGCMTRSKVLADLKRKQPINQEQDEAIRNAESRASAPPSFVAQDAHLKSVLPENTAQQDNNGALSGRGTDKTPSSSVPGVGAGYLYGTDYASANGPGPQTAAQLDALDVKLPPEFQKYLEMRRQNLTVLGVAFTSRVTPDILTDEMAERLPGLNFPNRFASVMVHLEDLQPNTSTTVSPPTNGGTSQRPSDGASQQSISPPSSPATPFPLKALIKPQAHLYGYTARIIDYKHVLFTKLHEKAKSYIGTKSDAHVPKALCCARTADNPGLEVDIWVTATNTLAMLANECLRTLNGDKLILRVNMPKARQLMRENPIAKGDETESMSSPSSARVLRRRTTFQRGVHTGSSSSGSLSSLDLNPINTAADGSQTGNSNGEAARGRKRGRAESDEKNVKRRGAVAMGKDGSAGAAVPAKIKVEDQGVTVEALDAEIAYLSEG